MAEDIFSNPEARAVGSRGFLVRLRCAAVWACLTLCLPLVPNPAYAQSPTPEGPAAVEPPSLEFGVSALHTFPLKMWLATTVDPYGLPTNPEEALRTLRWQVSGEGKLWDEDPGTLELRFGNRLTLDSRRNFVEYVHPDFRLALGEGWFSLSPLVRGGSGFGLDAEGALELEPDLGLGAHVVAYRGNDGGRFGLRMSAAVLAQAEASVSVLTNLSGPDTLLSGQLQFTPKIEELETLDVGLEYGVHFGDASTRRALDLSTKLAEGPNGVSLLYQQVEAGYRNAPDHSSRLDVNGKLQLSEVPKVNASVRLRREVRHEADQPLSEAPAFYNLQVGGTLSGSIKGVDLSLKYDNRNVVRNGLGTSRERNRVGFSVGVPLTRGFRLHQSLEWERDLEEGALYETLLYSAEADLPVLKGNVRPQVALGYNLRDGAFDAFNVGAGYFGLITETFNLLAGSGLYLADGTFFYLLVGGSYGFEDGQTLNFNASTFVFGPSEPLLELSLGYSLPINLPLSY